MKENNVAKFGMHITEVKPFILDCFHLISSRNLRMDPHMFQQWVLISVGEFYVLLRPGTGLKSLLVIFGVKERPDMHRC